MADEAKQPKAETKVDAKADTKSKAEPKAKQPKAYISDKPTYIGGVYYKAGEAFVTDAPKGEGWEEVDEGEKAAIDASKPGGAGDPSLEAMDIAELRALALTKKVNADGLNKADLITAIRAADEPKL